MLWGGTAVAQAQLPLPDTTTIRGLEYHKQDDNTWVQVEKQEDGSYEKVDGGKSFTREQLADELGVDFQPLAPLDEDSESNTANTDGSEVTRHDTGGAPITVDGVKYFPQEDGSYLSKPENGNPVKLTADQAKPFLPGQQDSGVDTSDIPAPATKEDKDGNTWYQHIQDPTIYVKDSNDVNVEITKEMREAYAKAFPGETETEKKFDAKKLAWLALPAALIIGGITWYLTHDGKTYVKDEARKNEQPTAEEKAASEQMLKENKDEVIAQGGKLAEGNSAQGTTNGAQSTDNVRGMAAETGNNSIARGAVALAIAGLLAAGAFVARRKFFA